VDRLPEVCLLECLMPPLGYELISMIGSTYSMAPSVLLAMVVAANSPRQADEPFSLEDRSKEEILDAIQKGPRRSLFFCDHHGQLQEGRGMSAHERLVLRSVVKKEGRANNLCGSLHAKVVFALFHDGDSTYRARVYIGSKNLTDTLFNEFGMVAELEQTNAPSDAFTQSLTDYLRYLQAWEATRVRVEDKLQPLRKALNVLRKRRFRCVVPGARFHWQGRLLRQDESPAWTPLAQAVPGGLERGPPDAVHIHSPWVRQSALEHLMRSCGERTFFSVRCLDDRSMAASGDSRVRFDLYHGSGGSLQPYQSHAKIYLFRWRRDVLLAFGSANLTGDGWGLAAPGNRPNAEVLVTLPGSLTTYQQLIVDGQPLHARNAEPCEQDAADCALEFLEAIRIDIDYDTENETLCYRFDWPADHSLESVKITHDLVEDSDGRTELVVWDETGFPDDGLVRRSWREDQLYLLSPVLRLLDPTSGATVHVVLDLDIRFFDVKGRLKCMQYTAAEFVQSLAHLMEVPLNGVASNRQPGLPVDDDLTARFIEGLRLERYLYRMARLKYTAPKDYAVAIERVDRLLRLKASDSTLASSPLMDAIRAIQRAHEVLDGLKTLSARNRRRSN
jgi:hypothetical protein